MLRRAVHHRATSWVIAGAVALALWSSYVPVPLRGRLDQWSPFTQVVLLRPSIVIVALPAYLVSLLRGKRRRRRRASTVVALIGTLAAVVQMVPRATSSAAPATSDEPVLVVMTANVRHSQVRPRDVAALALGLRADVVVLPEGNARLARRVAGDLTAARGERWDSLTSPVDVADDDSTARPTSLVVPSRLDARRTATPAQRRGDRGMVAVRVGVVPDRDGRGHPGPTLLATHPTSPRPGSPQGQWRRVLASLQAPCRRGWIVAGDFNATVDHSAFRRLIGAGCRDAADATGRGLDPTFVGGAFMLVPPTVDHVLTSGRWRPVASGTASIPRSDHLAFWARIAGPR